jgi:hypothetical protein
MGTTFEQLPTYPQRWLLRKVVQVYEGVERAGLATDLNNKSLIQQTIWHLSMKRAYALLLLI